MTTRSREPDETWNHPDGIGTGNPPLGYRPGIRQAAQVFTASRSPLASIARVSPPPLNRIAEPSTAAEVMRTPLGHEPSARRTVVRSPKGSSVRHRDRGDAPS